ncbi:MAG: hypothetical protein NZM35_00905 [Chitinophagales bacterium]|nr:hypothetical protein [Chitinophagales bacterium]MDW8418985.1 hypothetical protein [Chitinophagales bacterium]
MIHSTKLYRNSLFILLTVSIFSAAHFGCKKEKPAEAKLIFKFKLDSTQVRLNNFGQPASIPAGNAGQSPIFNGISAHYIEMAPTMFTQIGQGAILYHQAETTTGGANAIDHSKAVIRKSGETFFEIPIKDVPPGTYEWLRVSLAYQNYNVKLRIDTTIAGFPINQFFDATIASFVGFNTYITNFNINTKNITVNGNKKQGFWGFETTVYSMTIADTGSAPVTTVPNPIFATSPIPPGSCVVTGAFENSPLTITGNETKDIVVEVSLSINKSFEWQDKNPNGWWEPLKGEQVVDMGLRGLIPRIQQ